MGIPTDFVAIGLFLVIGQVGVRGGYLSFQRRDVPGGNRQASILVSNAFRVEIRLPPSPSFVLDGGKPLHEIG